MTAKTKSILIYVGGVLTGIVLTFAFLIVLNALSNSQSDDIVMIENPTQQIKATSFSVFQVLPDGSALATADDFESLGLVVLFQSKNGAAYYDDQNIAVPSGKYVLQVGTFRYKTAKEIEKTVPVVEIVNR